MSTPNQYSRRLFLQQAILASVAAAGGGVQAHDPPVEVFVVGVDLDGPFQRCQRCRGHWHVDP